MSIAEQVLSLMGLSPDSDVSSEEVMRYDLDNGEAVIIAKYYDTPSWVPVVWRRNDGYLWLLRGWYKTNIDEATRIIRRRLDDLAQLSPGESSYSKFPPPPSKSIKIGDREGEWTFYTYQFLGGGPMPIPV